MSNKNDPENPSSKENENESALHIFKDFLVLDSYESDQYASSQNPRFGKNMNEPVTLREQKFYQKILTIKGNKEQEKVSETVNIGERRDPLKTKRDIEKDKFNKKTEDIVKKLESGLVPPGMETEVLVKPDSPKSLESLSATDSISPKNNIPGNTLKVNAKVPEKRVRKKRAFNLQQQKQLEYWKEEPPEMRYESPVWNQQHLKMSRSPPHNAAFPFRHRNKSPVRFPRSPERFVRVRSPKRFPRSRSPNGMPRSRSPIRFRGSRSPNRFPRSRSPNRFPRLRSPNRFQRQTQIRRSPIHQSRSHSRERESSNRRLPNPTVSRKRSTERFLKELIKTSGIQENTASPNLSQEFSNPEAPMMFEYPPPMFDCGPPPMAFPTFTLPGEVNPNMMPNNESIYYSNAADANSFSLPPPTFPPAPFPSFAANVAPEAHMYFPPPAISQEPVGNNPPYTHPNEGRRLLKEVSLQKMVIPESKDKTFPMNSKIKMEIISRCQDAVLKLDCLHFPNRLFSPPEEHATFNIHQSAKASPLRRQLPPKFSFTTKPNDSGAILLPSIISTIGLDETLSSMNLPPPSFTPTGQTKKDAYCQTDDYHCNYCQIRKHTPVWHKSTMTLRSSVSVHCQVTNDDLRGSKMIFTPNQSEAPLQEKPVSLMHMTPAQILVAELTAKAKSLQRSTVEAAQRVKQGQVGQSDSRTGPSGAGWMRDEQYDGDSYGHKHGQSQSQMGKSNSQDPEHGYKEDQGSVYNQGKGYGQTQGQRRPPGQGLLKPPAQTYQQGQDQGYPQGQGQGYDQDQNYGSGITQNQSKLTREYDEFLQRIQNEKHPTNYGNRRNNARY